jgi:Flp pilus assembly protein TadD
LLANKQLPEAEKVFRADLDLNPRDGRALSGLRDALKAQGREYEALQIEQQYRDAWKTADAKTSLAR